MGSSSSSGELEAKVAAAPTASADKTLDQYLADHATEIAKALPQAFDTETFVRMALTTVKTGDGLLACTHRSVLASMMLAAQLGFEPARELGYVWFIPRPRKIGDQRVMECTFQVGWQGWAELARRSGAVYSIEARVVYAADEFDYRHGTDPYLTHKPAPQLAKDPVAVYCLANLASGHQPFVVLSWEDALSYRRFATTTKVWDAHPEEMAQKTAFLRLRKWLPRSIEMDRALRHDGTAPAMDLSPNMLEVDPIDDPPELAA